MLDQEPDYLYLSIRRSFVKGCFSAQALRVNIKPHILGIIQEKFGCSQIPRLCSYLKRCPFKLVNMVHIWILL